MENEKKQLGFAPYIPNNVPENQILVAPEGVWHPMDDGIWPLHPFSYGRWEKEELSWYDNCYIHAGLNPFMFYDVKGKIICDGILIRRTEEDFICANVPDPAMFNQQMGNKFAIKSEDTSCKRFFFQLCGPASLQIVEEAVREDLYDLKFMYTKDTRIEGKDVFILRTSMAGTLGYEVHGAIEDAHVVYNKLLEVGEKYKIQKLGRYAYVNAHCEGSIPQLCEHFSSPFIP